MPNLYPFGGADGPWATDDDAVLLDGYLSNGSRAGGHPSVDGVDIPRLRRRRGRGNVRKSGSPAVQIVHKDS